MKTIQTQNRESMGCSYKKVIRIGILIMVLLSVVVIFVQCRKNRYSAKIYSDENEILSIFHENTEEFDQMAVMLHQNAFFNDRFGKYGDRTMFSPYTFKWKKYFSEEKYKELECFYLDFRPCCISDWEYMQIDFLSKTATLSFFYINIADNHYGYEVDVEERLKSKLQYLSQDYEVIPLDNNWYYRISPPPVVQD